ncbi:MAG: exosome complex protein Rrp42 [Candidatus Aenigmarchaeota archaeon]|nr:exosome complex protein Rrp42 [Candidatus Aenigmarchaeota archaeon]
MIIQKQFISGLASRKMRIDKRGQDEFRDITIETGVIAKAEGSARVKIGKTEVIAGVKMGVGTPFPDRPDEGVLMIGAEFSPIASPDFEKGPPAEDAIELARVVDRGIRESGAIDMKKLCIKEKEKTWMVFVDIHILNHAGNLIDAAGLASIAALLTAKMPEYDEEAGTVSYEKKHKKLPMKFKPVPITVFKMSDSLFLDPNLEEEDVTSVSLTVTTKDDGNIVALQKGGSQSLSLEEIEKAFELSLKKGAEIRKLLEKHI